MECDHDWVSGPYWVVTSVTMEEPEFYPPTGFDRLEHCTKCGTIRLPEAARKYTGKNKASGKIL
jgi:hypothetical protein